MAQVIGNVKSFETGTFFAKGSDGQVRQLKAGDSIYEGEDVYGAAANGANAKIVIDVLLAGAGDLVLGGNGALTFDTSVLEGMFSHNDAVVYVNSVKEPLATVAPSDAGADTDIIDAGETAAGDAVTDTERAGDIFAARTGAVGDVSTGLLDSIGGAEGMRATDGTRPVILETTVVGDTDISVIKPLSDAPKLDVVLRAVESGDENDFDFENVSYSSFGIGASYLSEGKLIMDDDGNVPSVDSAVYWNHGNGYGITTTDEGANNKHQIDLGEALVLDLKTEVDSITIPLKHLLHDTTVSWEAYDSNGSIVGSGTATSDNDSIFNVAINPDGDNMRYIVFLGSDDGYNVKGPLDAVAATSYEYVLDINEASLSDTAETLGTVVVTGLPAGSVLVHDSYPDIIVPEDGTVTFESDMAIPTSWSMTLEDELPNDTSIIATLMSTEGDATSAITAVGVYGDNDIIGGEGNDMLTGGDGDDTLFGDGGNDVLVSDIGTIGGDSQVDAIDGGNETDTLVLSEGSSIDFGVLESLNNPITNIEAIDLSLNGDHQLQNISHYDILDITGGGTTLTILGNTAADTVTVDSTTMSYEGTSTEVFNGVSYDFDIYTSNIDPTVTLRVENIITADII